jgi:hypothetical protein
MKTETSIAIHFIKVAAISFVSIVALAVAISIAFSMYSQAMGARVSAGAFDLQVEDFFWVGVISVVIGAVAAVVRFVRRGSRTS